MEWPEICIEAFSKCGKMYRHFKFSGFFLLYTLGTYLFYTYISDIEVMIRKKIVNRTKEGIRVYYTVYGSGWPK